MMTKDEIQGAVEEHGYIILKWLGPYMAPKLQLNGAVN